MNCYYIEHKETGLEKTIFGYSFINACERSKLNPAEWIVIMYEYID